MSFSYANAFQLVSKRVDSRGCLADFNCFLFSLPEFFCTKYAPGIPESMIVDESYFRRDSNDAV